MNAHALRPNHIFNSDLSAERFHRKFVQMSELTSHLSLPQLLSIRKAILSDTAITTNYDPEEIHHIFQEIVVNAMKLMEPEALHAIKKGDFKGVMPPDGDRNDLAFIELACERMLEHVGHIREPKASLIRQVVNSIRENARTVYKKGGTVKRKLGSIFGLRTGKPAVKKTQAKKKRSGQASGAAPQKPGTAPIEIKPVTIDNELFTEICEPRSEAERAYFDAFDDALNHRIGRLLDAFRVHTPVKRSFVPYPFLTSSQFRLYFAELLKSYVYPTLRTARQIRGLGDQKNWQAMEQSDARVAINQLIKQTTPPSPIQFAWNAYWGSMTETKDEISSVSGFTIAAKVPGHFAAFWDKLKDNAKKHNYVAPTARDVHVLSKLLSLEPGQINDALKEMKQIYLQEFETKNGVSQGTLRNCIIKYSDKLPPNMTEFLVANLFYTCESINGAYLKNLLRNFGRAPSDQRNMVPYLYRFADTAVEAEGNDLIPS